VLSAELLAVQDDALLRQLFVEWSAVEFGDTESVYRIIRSAAGKGADTSHAFIVRAKSVLAKVPADDLKRVLGRIEMVEPELLKALIEQGKIV
jgi:putative chitinase